MKVLIVNNMAPFVWGGAEALADHLQNNLIHTGHEAEILRIPFQWEPATGIPAQMHLVNALELKNVDHVIALKFPAYLIRHPKKTFWLLHQYRQAYDLFDAGQTNLPSNEEGEAIRAFIKTADNECFAQARHIYTNSAVTQQRLLKYNGFHADVLLPPVNDPELFAGGPYGDYIFAGGRVNGMKRQHLLIEAMLHTKANVKLLVAGPPDTPGEAQKLQEMVCDLKLQDRVKLDLRFLPRSTYAQYVNEAAAVAYLPFDEDSLGYVAMEAATAKKPIITTVDSGGILGLVKNEETGWVSEANSQTLARAMDEVFANTQTLEQYGQAARQTWDALGVNWPQTLQALLK